MNLKRNSQMFSQSSIKLWIVTALLLTGLSLRSSQLRQQERAEKMVAIENLAAKVGAGETELKQLTRDIAALDNRGRAAAAEIRSIQNRLDNQRRKSENIQSELKSIARD